MSNKRVRVALLACALLLAPGGTQAGAGPRVILLVADRLSVAELRGEDTPHLAGLLGRGGLGLMCAGAADRDAASAYATLGAGARVALGGRGGPAFEVDELCGGTPAGRLYRRRWGGEGIDGRIVIPSWPEILRAAGHGSPGARPGGLGAAVKLLGLATALVGNADRPGEVRRWASLIAADGSGLIDYGGVGPDFVSPQPDGAYGVTAAWEVLLDSTARALERASLVVVDTGQTLRADEYARFCAPAQAAALKKRSLLEFDAFLGGLLDLLDSRRDLLVLVVPAPPGGQEQPPRQAMTAVVVEGPGFGPGLLISPATRWPGVVAATDLAPTILGHLGGSGAPGMVGRPIRGVPAPGHVEAWAELEARLAANEDRRAPLLRGYVLAQIAVVAGMLAAVCLALPLASLLRPFLLALPAVPLGFLLLGAVPLWSPVTSATAVVAFSLAPGLLLGRRQRGGLPFVLITLATVLALTADVAGGCRLIRFSPLGYSPVGAFRFYGLGNEFMGVYVGACLVGFTGLADRGGRWGFLTCAVGLGVATAVLAAPTLGANLGGALTAAIAFSWTLSSLKGTATATRRATLALSTGVAVALLATGLDVLGRPPSLQSHLGMAGREVLGHGVAGLLPILERKLAINVRLIRYTIWSRVLVSSLAGFALLFCRPPGVVRRLLGQHPALACGFTGVLLGAFVALAVNDSGVVAAATTMIYATATLAYLTLEQPQT
ncbi:MAG: hypothetical protein RDU89_00340 [bacterium]|nr:hypothetical protein [bacterium]